ncbi:MAG: hypothetical protein ACI4GV_08015 [Acutalibacteraceae bacterium]
MPFYSYGNEIKYTITDLSSVNRKLIEDFSCGNDEIDKVIKNSNSIECTLKLIVDEENECLIGFITYQASGIRLYYSNDAITKPALQINYFAIDSHYQHLPYEDSDDSRFNLSDDIFCEFLKMFRNISDKYLYFEYIILYSVPNAKNFYIRNCFEEFNTYMSPDKYRYLDGCVPMYMSL